MGSTRGHQSDDFLFGESTFEYAQSFEEFDLEQSCLLRLKNQREKIEELSKLYAENEKELVIRSEKEKKLEEEVERLTDLSEYKKLFDELKRDYDGIVKRNHIYEAELNTVKGELEHVLNTTADELDQLKAELRLSKEQRLLSDSHWEAIVLDKEEQIRKQARGSQEKEYELSELIRELKEEIETLKEALSDKGSELVQRNEYFHDEFKLRE